MLSITITFKYPQLDVNIEGGQENMSKSSNMVYKTLVIAIIILCIGMSITPSIAIYNKKKSLTSSSGGKTLYVDGKNSVNYNKQKITHYNSNELLFNDKKAYSYNAYCPSMEIGFYYFYLDDPGNITYFQWLDILISGGTWTNDGKWLCCFYNNGVLVEVDPEYGWVYIIGGGGVGLNGLAYNPTNNKLYGVSSYALYEIDINTGEQDYIGSFNNDDQAIIGIAFDANGVLYAWDVKYSGDSYLYTVDILTGQATIVGSLGLTLCYAQDGAFDYETDTLYLSAYVISPFYGGYLIDCDEDTGNCNIIGQFEGDAELDALAIPYNWSGPTAVFTWTPSLPNPDETIFFNASASYDPEGYITLYEWDWDTDGVFDENHTNPTANHSWPDYGFYPVTLKVIDNGSLTGNKTKTVRVGNQPPDTPVINGPSSGNPDTEYCFTFHSTDADGDNIKYFIDWSDGINNETAYVHSCVPIEVCRTFSNKGTYYITAVAVDVWGAYSEAGCFEFEIPRTRATTNIVWLQWFLESYPLFERLFSLIKAI